MSVQSEQVKPETLAFARYEWVKLMRRNGNSYHKIMSRIRGFAEGEVKEQVRAGLKEWIRGDRSPEARGVSEEMIDSL